MYAYKMLCLGGNLVYLLENFGKLHSKISRFLFLPLIPVKIQKSLSTKQLIKCKNYLFYDKKF